MWIRGEGVESVDGDIEVVAVEANCVNRFGLLAIGWRGNDAGYLLLRWTINVQSRLLALVLVFDNSRFPGWWRINLCAAVRRSWGTSGGLHKY